MTLGRVLPSHRAVAAAHEWVRETLKAALLTQYPSQKMRALYSDAALSQIDGIIRDLIDSYKPSQPRRAEWD